MTRIKLKMGSDGSLKYRWRESDAATRECSKTRYLCVALDPSNIMIRPKGTRQILRLPISMAYLLACKLEAARRSAEKAAKRKSKKK